MEVVTEKNGCHRNPAKRFATNWHWGPLILRHTCIMYVQYVKYMIYIHICNRHIVCVYKYIYTLTYTYRHTGTLHGNFRSNVLTSSFRRVHFGSPDPIQEQSYLGCHLRSLQVFGFQGIPFNWWMIVLVSQLGNANTIQKQTWSWRNKNTMYSETFSVFVCTFGWLHPVLYCSSSREN